MRERGERRWGRKGRVMNMTQEERKQVPAYNPGEKKIGRESEGKEPKKDPLRVCVVQALVE